MRKNGKEKIILFISIFMVISSFSITFLYGRNNIKSKECDETANYLKQLENRDITNIKEEIYLAETVIQL